jgi:hypothetical protein
MTGGSWVLMLAGWVTILAGLIVTLFGFLWIAALFSGGGAPTGGVALFLMLALVAGPILLLGGPAVIVSAVKFMGGRMWARSVLEVFWWLILALPAAYLVYTGFTKKEITSQNVVQGTLFLLATSVPAFAMVLLLRSDAVRRILIR